MSPDLNDEEIIIGLMKREQTATKLLYSAVFQPISSFVIRNNGSKEEAIDLMQDVFIALIEKIDQSKLTLKENSSLSAYTYGIAKNLWFSKIREKKNSNPIPDDKVLGANEVKTNCKEFMLMQRLAGKYLNKINPECEKLLTLYYYENKSLAEIAEIMNLTSGYIKQKKFRCMNKLRKLIFLDKDYQDQNPESDE